MDLGSFLLALHKRQVGLMMDMHKGTGKDSQPRAPEGAAKKKKMHVEKWGALGREVILQHGFAIPALILIT